jgi:hypothetical protein
VDVAGSLACDRGPLSIVARAPHGQDPREDSSGVVALPDPSERAIEAHRRLEEAGSALIDRRDDDGGPVLPPGIDSSLDVDLGWRPFGER